MANRMGTAISMETLEKRTKIIFAKVSFGASGAPTLVKTQSKGVLSVVRNSAGSFTLTFGVLANGATKLDTYNKLLNVRHVFNTQGAGGAVPASPGTYIINDSTGVVGTASITIGHANGTTPTDPASGEVALYAFVFGDSTAQ